MLHPDRRARLETRQKVEQPSRGFDDADRRQAMPVADDETLFSRNSHRNPKDIGSELGYLAADTNFLSVIPEESAAVAHEFEARKPALHQPRGSCIRKLG